MHFKSSCESFEITIMLQVDGFVEKWSGNRVKTARDKGKGRGGLARLGPGPGVRYDAAMGGRPLMQQPANLAVVISGLTHLLLPKCGLHEYGIG